MELSLSTFIFVCILGEGAHWGKTCEIAKRDLCVNHYVCVFAFCTITSTLRELYKSCKGGGGQQFLELVVTLNK
jgi:hypothetical protein